MFNYAPDEVNVVVAGFIPLNGFVDGTFIEISKDVPPFTSNTTSDGFVSRVYNNSPVYTLKITLIAASNSNQVMDKLWKIDQITQKGKFPIIIKDQSGSDLFFSTTAWIEDPPNMTKGTIIEGNVWTLKCSQAIINFGGNEEVSSLVDDLANAAIASLPILEGII